LTAYSKFLLELNKANMQRTSLSWSLLNPAVPTVCSSSRGVKLRISSVIFMQNLYCILVRVAIRLLSKVVFEEHMKRTFCGNINRIQHSGFTALVWVGTVNMYKATHTAQASGGLREKSSFICVQAGNCGSSK